MIIILVCFLSALNVPVTYLIKFCNQVISQVVCSFTPVSFMTFTKNKVIKNKVEAFREQKFMKQWMWQNLKRNWYMCMYGTNQSLLLKGLNHSVTLRQCGCYPVFAIVGFFLVHLKQLMLQLKLRFFQLKNTKLKGLCG